MRDEVFSEWQIMEEGSILHVYCHVSGGLFIGNRSLRENMFRREMPLVLEAICAGDSKFFNENTDFDNALSISAFSEIR